MPTLDLRYEVKEGASVPFVYSSWLKSYRWSGKHDPNYYKATTQQVEKLLDSETTVIAVLADDPDCYIGWACGSLGSLKYVYVKTSFRRDGIAKELIRRVSGLNGVYTFQSRNKDFLNYLEKKGFRYAKNRRERDQRNLSKRENPGDRQNDSNSHAASIVERQTASA